MEATLQRVAAARASLPVRRTERLVLRPWREEDREPFAALNADPAVAEFLPSTLTRAESDALIDQLRLHVVRHGLGIWAVEERETRGFLGFVGLAVPSFAAPFLPGVEIAWRLARHAWGKGYATEAAKDVLVYGLQELHLPRILSWTVPANRRSWGVMERIGMTRIGAFDHPKLPEGHPLRPHVLYSIEPKRPEPVVVLPQVWLDGDGCPKQVKEIVWRAAQRGTIAVTMVANRDIQVPRHPRIRMVVVKKGMDVADDWLVAHAQAGDLVVTSDVPLAAELVPRGVEVLSPRGEWFTPSNIGEKLSLRDFFTDARASGMIEGGGPGAYDDRVKQQFANGLDRWITRKRVS